MSLIIIQDEGDFLGIEYLDGKHLSIRRILVRELQYNDSTGDIIMISVDGNTIPLNYADTEDPDNLGNSFGSTEEIWNWVVNTLSGLNSPAAANAVTHLTVVVEHNTVTVTHT